MNYQNDYMEKGAMPVPGADANYRTAMDNFIKFVRAQEECEVIWCQEEKPKDHVGFLSNYSPEQRKARGLELYKETTLKRRVDDKDVEFFQTMWPNYCVAGTPGA